MAENEGMILHAIGKLEGKMDFIAGKIPEHDKRISNLERWKAWIVGAAFGTTAVVNVGWHLVSKLFQV